VKTPIGSGLRKELDAGSSGKLPWRDVEYRVYRVDPHGRGPLLEFMLDAIKASGCSILQSSPPDEAPFRISFVTAAGERLGIVVYAFRATFTPTKNRPIDEHTFQLKYGSKKYGEPAEVHDLWQDPFGLYTTLCCGINPEQGFFVGIDPEMHNPTKFFIRFEFKQRDVDEIHRKGWHYWERDIRRERDEPVEVVVGGRAQSFLQYIRFERMAFREDQGHRQLLAERMADAPTSGLFTPAADVTPTVPSPPMLHELAKEFEMPERQVLDLIASARRLKMAVRGWVAEEKLVEDLKRVHGVSECQRIDIEGGADVTLRYLGSNPITVQCKNVLRGTTAAGEARMDFQKTRVSKGDHCSRFYEVDEFDLIAACLHAVTLRWTFSYAVPAALDMHASCPGRLSNRVRIDDRWSGDAAAVLALAAATA
jgi:hypothetical protein